MESILLIKLSQLPHWAIFTLLIGSAFLCVTYIPIPLSTPVFMIVYSTWLLSLAAVANSAYPKEARKAQVKLWLALGYAVLYALILSLFIGPFNNYVMLFHLLAMYCMFYSLYNVATRMKSVALNKVATFSESIDIFAGLWFFPAGVWFIQPKANAIVSKLSR